jgi:hypothetical protein
MQNTGALGGGVAPYRATGLHKGSIVCYPC